MVNLSHCLRLESKPTPMKNLLPNSTMVPPKISRSNHPGVFCKKGVLRNFAKFKGKKTCARVSFFIEHLWWLLQDFNETTLLFTKILFKHLEIKFDSNNCICACRNKLIRFENCSSKSP